MTGIVTKICGVSDRAALDAAIGGGAGFVGLMFYAPSPRAISHIDAAELAAYADGRVPLVGVFVDAEDAWLETVTSAVPLSHLQLHGNESPERVAAIRARFGLPVIKAVAIGGVEDIARAHLYEAVADRLLFDAKPPEGFGYLPGGNALSFDWRLIARENWGTPWILSGGLTADNLAEAVATSRAALVDVSSGVERAKGQKDPALIRAFLEAASRIKSPEHT
jgi:phosphoribosylanthranilate isomerase